MIRCAAALLACSLFTSRPAQAQTLKLGDAAPPLAIAEWVQGKPVDLAREGKRMFHVVEFWAVWCPPCKMSVPLLTELQKKYEKNVTIIGVTEPDARGNSPDAIRHFVREQGEKMQYHVAIDTGQTTHAYLAGAGVVGIPHAYVVDKQNKIVWQGSPLDPALDDVLGRLVAGTYDVDTARREEEVNRRLEELSFRAQLGQWTAVWDGLVEILKLDPANVAALDALQGIALNELETPDQYRNWVRKHIDEHKANRQAMQRLADTLLAVNDMTQRMPDLALDAARAAYRDGGEKDARAATVYARALYQIGMLDRAITLQQDAVAVATDRDRPLLQGILDYYRKCKELSGVAD